MKKLIPHLIALFIQPTLSAFYSISRWWEKGAQINIILFTALIGYTAYPINSGLDLHYYLTYFAHGYERENPMDVYVTFLREIVFYFTQNSHIFMGVVGIILGYFVSKSMTRFSRSHDRIIGFILVFLFLSVFAIYMIGGVRFVTAFYVYFYGIASFIQTEKKKYLLLACLSPLIHYTFIVALLVFFFSFIMREYKLGLKFLLISSFIFSFLPASISYDLIFSKLLSISGFYQGGIEYYVSEEGSIELLEHAATAKWYTSYSQDFIKYTLLIVAYILYRKRDVLIIEKNVENLIILASSFFIVSNFFQYVPHFGLRFSKIYLAFAIYALFCLYIDNQTFKQFRKYIICIGFSSIVFIAITFKNNLDIFPFEKVLKPLLFHFI